jgi:hypothetical protein
MAKKTLLCLALFLTCAIGYPPLQAQVPQAPAGRPSAPPPNASEPETGTTLLLGRIWRITSAPSQSPAGSIYIFLSNGTLLEASCVETYRVATWAGDKKTPRVLHVVEDKRPAFTAVITELTPTTLKLEQNFSRSHERREIALTAVQGEYVCPDMPK